jgi:hypothetical protein
MSAGAHGAEAARYETLLAHAELELELAGRGELAELTGLEGRWEQLVAALPAEPPAGAASSLAKARLIHERTRIELLRLREGLLRELAGAEQAKRTAAGYAGTAGGAGARALDRSA